MTGSNGLSSPASHSPTSLPPPAQPRLYSFVNGHSVSANGSPAESKPPSPYAPYQSSSQTPSFPPPGSPYYYKAQNPPQSTNKPSERRSSTSFPSPLASAPVLTPRQYNNPPSTPGLPEHNAESHAYPQIPHSSPSKHSSPLPSYTQSFQISDHATALPPATTGFSPTKHSPPRPSTSNGGVEQATPSVLPPVAPLLPSSPVQNLSPPVKPADPEHARQLSASMTLGQQ